MEKSQVPVFILAGGLGTRLKEETEFRPKPMVLIGDKPVLWHIMRTYSRHGFRRFIICAGFKSEVIKSYFLNYFAMNCDFTVNLKTQEVVFSDSDTEDWTVTVVDTGELTQTGGRISRALTKYLGVAEHFAVTYGDGLTDLNLSEEFEFHLSHDRLATVMGHSPPSRFGELVTNGDRVTHFAEKPQLEGSWINAGYFFFRKGFANYLSPAEDCVLEKEPLVKLAEDGQLMIYKHRGFWACMDTQRDKETLTRMWVSGQAPWKA